MSAVKNKIIGVSNQADPQMCGHIEWQKVNHYERLRGH